MSYGDIDLLAVRIVEIAIRDYNIVEGNTEREEAEQLIEFFNSKWFEILIDCSTTLNAEEVRKWIVGS